MTTINIYYGGRGLIDDPSIYVMDKLTTVFDELNVNVKRYNLYEDKHGISVLPKTLKEADAVIITASVEWFGIGGLLQQFLDACSTKHLLLDLSALKTVQQFLLTWIQAAS